ncbi:MAG: deoxynucleoside kinase [Saprospiraceae bacterium]|nr:deoxynucleoside kinase [Saprospiraceae bacterium]
MQHRFIAIEGNIGTGKTTLCHRLADSHGYALVLEQFTDNPFLPFFYDQPERYAFPVELFFMTERHKQLQEHFAQPDLFRNTTVADYFFVKTLLFAKNNLNEEEFRLFQRLFTVLNNSYPKPDLLLYLHRPVEVLLRQIQRRGRDMERNISAAYLTEIQEAYFDYFKTEEEIPIVVLDLGEANFLSEEQVYAAIVALLHGEFEKGLQFRSL